MKFISIILNIVKELVTVLYNSSWNKSFTIYDRLYRTFPTVFCQFKMLWLDENIAEIKKTPRPNNKIWKIEYVK